MAEYDIVMAWLKTMKAHGYRSSCHEVLEPKKNLKGENVYFSRFKAYIFETKEDFLYQVGAQSIAAKVTAEEANTLYDLGLLDRIENLDGKTIKGVSI